MSPTTYNKLGCPNPLPMPILAHLNFHLKEAHYEKSIIYFPQKGGYWLTKLPWMDLFLRMDVRVDDRRFSKEITPFSIPMYVRVFAGNQFVQKFSLYQMKFHEMKQEKKYPHKRYTCLFLYIFYEQLSKFSFTKQKKILKQKPRNQVILQLLVNGLFSLFFAFNQYQIFNTRKSFPIYG